MCLSMLHGIMQIPSPASKDDIHTLVHVEFPPANQGAYPLGNTRV